MLTKKGFTLIESLLTLSIIMALSLITIGTIKITAKTNLETETNQVVSLLEDAKTNALCLHQTTEVTIDFDTISYTSENSDGRELVLSSGFYFDDIPKLSFNQNGNINQANHLNVCNDELCQSIVFNLGTGEINVKQAG